MEKWHEMDKRKIKSVGTRFRCDMSKKIVLYQHSTVSQGNGRELRVKRLRCDVSRFDVSKPSIRYPKHTIFTMRGTPEPLMGRDCAMSHSVRVTVIDRVGWSSLGTTAKTPVKSLEV